MSDENPSDEYRRSGGRHPELSGRVAVVTGAARGIGLGIARRLAAEGMRLVVVDIDGSALDRAVTSDLEPAEPADTALLPIVADVGQPDQIDRIFTAVVDTHGTVDLLVNNAADLRRREAMDEHPELLDRQLAVNVSGPYLCSQHAARVMAGNGGGAIVNLSSVGAVQAHHRGLPYDITKGAIDAMTRTMAVDLGRYGIRVNAIGPGVTHTQRADTVDPERRRRIADRIPLERYGTVEDIAAAVAFLASDDAAYITGQTIYVDGGITAQLSPRTEPL